MLRDTAELSVALQRVGSKKCAVMGFKAELDNKSLVELQTQIHRLTVFKQQHRRKKSRLPYLQMVKANLPLGGKQLSLKIFDTLRRL